jgi:2-amino-4-hydroxy-6-hydroxymethyldihydropteridine diphosphokinase
LGANLGDRERTILAAVFKLRDTEGIRVTQVSTLLENPAVGGPPDAPPYLNGAAELRVSLSAQALFRRLMQIERELGRTRQKKWDPREIDLDLLLFGNQIISTAGLVVPHPLMHERKFVLQPLAEIAPEAVHPVLQMTVGGLLEDLLRREQTAAPGMAEAPPAEPPRPDHLA